MGYDVNRFEGSVDEELICSICVGVLENPVQAPVCEHAFCSACITEWLQHQQTCPVDRAQMSVAQLKPAARILRNLLGRLMIRCEYRESGCTAVIRLDALSEHMQTCDFNPKKPIPCTSGCGMVVPKDEMSDHNCVRVLRQLVLTQQQTINELKTDLSDCKIKMIDYRRDIQSLREYLYAMRFPPSPPPPFSAAAQSNSMSAGVVVCRRRTPDGLSVHGGSASSTYMPALDGTGASVSASVGGASLPERDRDSLSAALTSETLRWASSLSPARVTRWGGLVSTPDAVLQTVVRRALLESGCPQAIIGELMENSHERRWPAGLATLEARQLNRRFYEAYVIKRIPGKQAVVLLACENEHVSPDFVVEPGIVMIFAHGVE